MNFAAFFFYKEMKCSLASFFRFCRGKPYVFFSLRSVEKKNRSDSFLFFYPQLK